MDPAPKRPWYRLHWPTWLAMAIMAAALAPLETRWNFASRVEYSFGGVKTFSKHDILGWPLTYLQVDRWGPGFPPPTPSSKTEYTWFRVPLMVDLLVCLLMVLSVGHVAETWGRSRKLKQFSLRTLLVVTGVVAVFIGVVTDRIPISLLLGKRGYMQQYLFLERDLTDPFYWPAFFGLACTIYFLGWLACFAALCCWSLVRRSRV